MTEFPTKELLIAVIEKDDAILMRKKPDGSEPYKETWYIFGCERNPNEIDSMTLKNYLDETFGIKVGDIERIDQDTEVKKDHDGITKEFIYTDFRCKYESGEVKIPEGIEKIEWIPKDKLSDYDIVPPSLKLFKKIKLLNNMSNIFIIHGTEGYPEENWFPWLKEKLETKGHKVIIPQFPSPPIVPAKISEWFEVLEKYKEYINTETVFIGHSLGGVFTLRVLEKLNHKIKMACFTGTPIGVKPILNYERDDSFSSFDFDWNNIKYKAEDFIVFQSDNDPYVSLANGQELSQKLEVELSFVPNAGHFNKKAGYITFPELLEKLESFL